MLQNLRHVTKLMFKYERTYVSIDIHEVNRIEVRFDAQPSHTFKTGIEAVNHINDSMKLDNESYILVEKMVREVIGTIMSIDAVNNTVWEDK